MAIPTIIRSTDPGAPVLNGLAGSGYTVMKHALVMCGWTLEYDDPENFKCVFRNNPVSGSGCYVRVDDNLSTAMHESTLMSYRVMSIIVYEDMTSIDDGIAPHVRPDISWFKKSHTLDSVARPWVMIADDKTAYLQCSNTGQVSTTSSYSLAAFGDYHSKFPHITRSMQSVSTLGRGNVDRLHINSLLLSSSDVNLNIGRVLSSQLPEMNNCKIGWNIPNISVSTSHGIGGTGQGTKPTVVPEFEFVSPVIKPNSTSPFTYGFMRGCLLPVSSMLDETDNSIMTVIGDHSVFNMMHLRSTGGAGNGSSGSSAEGVIYIIIDRDWDDETL